jgi:hypothetical protein
MSNKAKPMKELSKVLAMERRLGNEYDFNQQSHKQQILRKEHDTPHFVQSFVWKGQAHLLKYQ